MRREELELEFETVFETVFDAILEDEELDAREDDEFMLLMLLEILAGFGEVLTLLELRLELGGPDELDPLEWTF